MTVSNKILQGIANSDVSTDMQLQLAFHMHRDEQTVMR
jgi:hypothetical protein